MIAKHVIDMRFRRMHFYADFAIEEKRCSFIQTSEMLKHKIINKWISLFKESVSVACKLLKFEIYTFSVM